MGMPYFILWARIAQSVWLLTTGWTFRGSSPRWGRDFPHPSRPTLGPTQPPKYWILTPYYGCNTAGAWRGVTTHLHLEPRLKKKKKTFTSTPPFGLSRPVQGRPLPLPHVTLFLFPFFCYAEQFCDLLQTLHWEIQIFIDIVHGYSPWRCVTYTVGIASSVYCVCVCVCV
jgi:hypothetical protein